MLGLGIKNCVPKITVVNVSLLSFPDLVLAELSAVGDDNRSHILTSRKTISRVKVSVLLPLL